MFNIFRVVLQKAYREEGKKEAGVSLYAQMPQTIETVFAKELTKTQSDVSGDYTSVHICTHLYTVSFYAEIKCFMVISS